MGVAVLLATGAALLFQPALRRLERIADRWAFGARLDGYDVLSRFGALLQAAPGPDDLLPQLAEEICQALLTRLGQGQAGRGPGRLARAERSGRRRAL